MHDGGLLVAVMDTCVLMRAGLVEFLVGVRATGAYVAKWSDAIASELERVLPGRPEGASRRIRTALDGVPDPLLPVTDEDEARTYGHCDDLDRHVMAAGICARRTYVEAEVFLVTDNVRHFDKAAVVGLGINLSNPDEFGAHLLGHAPLAVLRTVDRRPPERFERYLRRMRSDGLTRTATAIENHFHDLDESSGPRQSSPR